MASGQLPDLGSAHVGLERASLKPASAAGALASGLGLGGDDEAHGGSLLQALWHATDESRQGGSTFAPGSLLARMRRVVLSRVAGGACCGSLRPKLFALKPLPTGSRSVGSNNKDLGGFITCTRASSCRPWSSCLSRSLDDGGGGGNGGSAPCVSPPPW